MPNPNIAKIENNRFIPRFIANLSFLFVATEPAVSTHKKIAPLGKSDSGVDTRFLPSGRSVSQ
jgi:hypothetical protein